MASISNPSVRDMKLPTGHVVPRLGELTTTNEIIRSVDNWPTLNGLFLSGQIGLTFDPDPDEFLASPEPLVLEAPVKIPEASGPVDTPNDAATATGK